MRGNGGLILECQYGAGEDVSYHDVQDWVDRVAEVQDYNHAMSATYTFYHGYIGDKDRLKCATKLYSTDPNIDGGWRQWDDVWRSF